MEELHAEIRWVPHQKMIADGITKRRGNLQELYRFMHEGTVQLVDENAEMTRRKEIREAGGRVARPCRVSWQEDKRRQQSWGSVSTCIECLPPIVRSMSSHRSQNWPA